MMMITIFSIFIEVEGLVVVTCQWGKGHLTALVTLLYAKCGSLLRTGLFRGMICIVGLIIIFNCTGMLIGGCLCCDELL